ncbi:alpha/beta fold hydrolase [Phycicoccus flavus]|uniref:alpha/beta fold hydrolase n=1 Tax=Phycicoccus flavus TaxID=2502783 RepID=UPI000FEB6A7A|nr:alpha/beta hydrolase [Phycicoccus flavus]NHA70100.1 alpha/beta hydrolase [Phycicoccus flavus]
MTTDPATTTVHGRSGPAVLLLPGGVASTDDFFPGLVEGLLDDPGCRVVVHDRPGTGTNPEPGTLAGAADHLRGVLRDTGTTPAVVVGQSLGAVVALLLAVEHPDVVSGLVLLDPTPVLLPDRCRDLERRITLLRRATAPSRLLTRVSGRPAGPGADAPRLAAAVRGLGEVADDLVDRPWPEVPAAVVVADRDRDPVARSLELMGARLGTEPVTWPGATHDVHRDDPLRVLQTVRDVVGRTQG